MMFCFSIVDPAKSAEPPIKVLLSLVNALRVSSEDFLVAKLLSSLIAIFFHFLKFL